MEKLVKILLAIFVLFVAIQVTLGVKKHNNFEKWKQCLQASDYSDSACKTCNYQYNRSGKFRLDQ